MDTLEGIARMPDEPQLLAIIECVTCDSWIEVYRHLTPDAAIITWNALDAQLCQHPPLQSCPQARVEVSRRFPNETI